MSVTLILALSAIVLGWVGMLTNSSKLATLAAGLGAAVVTINCL